jgi:hypothetical protein
MPAHEPTLQNLAPWRCAVRRYAVPAHEPTLQNLAPWRCVVRRYAVPAHEPAVQNLAPWRCAVRRYAVPAHEPAVQNLAPWRCAVRRYAVPPHEPALQNRASPQIENAHPRRHPLTQPEAASTIATSDDHRYQQRGPQPGMRVSATPCNRRRLPRERRTSLPEAATVSPNKSGGRQPPVGSGIALTASGKGCRMAAAERGPRRLVGGGLSVVYRELTCSCVSGTTAGLRQPLLVAPCSIAEEMTIFAICERTFTRAAGVSPPWVW